MATRRFAGLRMGALVLVIILGLGVGAWAAITAAMRRPPPAPLYTARDLPPLPSPAENGWTVLAHAARHVALPHLPEAVTTICGARKTSPRARWEAATAHAEVLAGIAGAAGPGLAKLDAMAARPAFVEACSPDPTQPCPRLAFTQLHRVAEAAALAAATGHRMADALHRAAALVVLDLRLAASARSSVGQTMSLVHLTRSLNLVSTLLADPTDADWQDPAVGPALERLYHPLAGLDPAVIDLRRAVVGEYLGLQALLGHLEHREQDRLRHQFGPAGLLFYDPGDTRARLDPYFRRLMAFARHPGPTAPAPMARQSAGSFWWLFNPIGKRLLDVGVPDLGRRLAWEVQGRTRLASQADAVRQALRARRPPPRAAPPAPPGDRRR